MKKRKYLIIVLIIISLPLLFFAFRFCKNTYYFYDDHLDIHGFVKQIEELKNGDKKIELEYLNPNGEGTIINNVIISSDTDIFSFGTNERIDVESITQYDYVCVKYGTTVLPFGIFDDTDDIIYVKVGPTDKDQLANIR